MKAIELYDFNFTTYDLQCRSIDLGSAPISAMVCEVPPGGASRIHNHAESEIFLFVDGEGVVRSGGQSTCIRAGQGIAFPPFAEHVIENASREHPLRMLSLYWMGDARQALEPAPSQRPVLIFSTPPTPNGDLHLGHLSGPYLAADVARRALRQRGRTALHVTGRDDNQTYVAMKAAATGISCEQVCDQYSAAIRDTLARAGVPLDGFITPDRTGAYARFAGELVNRLFAAGHIYRKRAPALVGQDGAYLHEAYVRGGCPHCGEESDGNACEACGRPNQCTDLVEPVDRRTGQPVRVAEIERLYFRFSAFSDRLSTVIKQTKMPARVFALAQRMIDEGLPDICISHLSPWGLPITVPGFEDQVLYVWFEMAAGYLFGAAHAIAPGVEPWEAVPRVFSGEVDIVHAYGFDNAYYHALLFPAVYLALEMDLVPPGTHLVNELLDLEGKKFSTSRNHLIWGRDLLSQVPADAVRFGLAQARPQARRANFSLAAFLDDTNAFFAELNLWLATVRDLLMAGDGTIPEPGAWLADHQAYYSRILRFVEASERAASLDGFAPHELSGEIKSFAADSLRFTQGQFALKDAGQGHGANYLRTAKALALLGLRSLAVIAEPVLPDTCRRMRTALEISDDPAQALAFAPPGRAPDWTAMPTFARLDAVARP